VWYAVSGRTFRRIEDAEPSAGASAQVEEAAPGEHFISRGCYKSFYSRDGFVYCGRYACVFFVDAGQQFPYAHLFQVAMAGSLLRYFNKLFMLRKVHSLMC